MVDTPTLGLLVRSGYIILFYKRKKLISGVDVIFGPRGCALYPTKGLASPFQGRGYNGCRLHSRFANRLKLYLERLSPDVKRKSLLYSQYHQYQ